MSLLFGQKFEILNRNKLLFLWIDIVPSHQKLGIILKNKVLFKKLKSPKNVTNKNVLLTYNILKWKSFLERMKWFLTLKIDFKGMILSFFILVLHYVYKPQNTMISFVYVDFWPRTYLILYPSLENLTTGVTIMFITEERAELTLIVFCRLVIK